MSGPQRRSSPSRPLLRIAIAGAVAAFVAAAGPAVPGIEVALRPMPGTLASLVDLDWPRWIHNVADLLQIVTILAAVLAWGSTRRGRPRTASSSSSSEVGSSTAD
jgi:hypothetical protein